MLPKIKFFRPEHIYCTGIGVKRRGADWQYYLPFKRVGSMKTCRPYADGDYPDSHVGLALPLSDSRVFVGNGRGELALIDLIADQVVVRAKIEGLLGGVVQISTDRRYLFAQGAYNLYVLDAATLEVVQSWHQIEQSGREWAPYTTSESWEVQQQKIENGTLERLDLDGPVREVGGGKLETRFIKRGPDAYGPKKRSGSYIFDIATGSIERKKDARYRNDYSRMSHEEFCEAMDAREVGPSFALKCPSYPPDGPLEFQAVVTREAMVALVVADQSRGAAIAVLEDLARRIEHDLETLIICDRIMLHLVLAGKPLEVKAFFHRFVQEHSVEAAPILRRLMLAYLNGIEGGEGSMPWTFSGVGDGQAIFALRALVLLDPDAHDVYRLYLNKGDLEHDHEPYALYTEYLARHGVRNEADVRFGIYLTLMGFLDAGMDHPTAFLKGAQRHTTPERFAEMTVEEAQRRYDDSQYSPDSPSEYWNRIGREFVEYLGRGPLTTFSKKVIEILTSRVQDESLMTVSPARADETVENPVENPDYKKWSRFAKGTAIVMKCTTSMLGIKGTLTITTKLVEISDDQLVLEMVTRIEGEKETTNKQTIKKMVELPSGMKKEDFGKPTGVTEQGEESVRIGNTIFATKWYKTKNEDQGGKMETQVWESEEVPGRWVKTVVKNTGVVRGKNTYEVIEIKMP